METQARYTVVGLFTLLIAAVGFVFVYWLHGFAGAGALALYRIRFETPVIGLRPGVAVLFNGLRVGEVTSVRLDPTAPKILMAQIAVDTTTPVRQDTQVGIDAQGLMGGATVSLTGGSSTAVLKPGADGEPPLLIATADETQSLTRTAKTALVQLDGILTDNAQPLRGMIANLSTFSDALARNSGRVDSILAGLEKMTGGGAPKPPPLSYNLSAPEFPSLQKSPGKALGMQIALPEPTALVAFETQKVLVAPSPNELKPLEDGQWADSVPKLVQTHMLESFENAGFAHVGKATDGFTPEVQLLLEIRSFQISLAAPPSARIEISAKLLGADGKIVAERGFRATAPAMGVGSPEAAAALNEAFQTVAHDIVVWAQATM
ncbi:MAG: ABC-type transport auxiliary lipoprotein family protein [Roseiarcus sp.]|jgi:phospholipid/cholesterol/gamma-HCH transport system substrate-binding protein